MRTIKFVASALLFMLAAPGIHAGGFRIALLASAEVQGDTIVLANLLPPDVSLRIRSVADKIALGSTPQNGASRQFGHDLLNTAIERAGLSPTDFAVPGMVTVHRGSRVLTREEVFAAINSALSRNPGTALPHLLSQDLSFDAEIRVPPGDAGLEVTQIVFDPLLGRIRFRICARSVPGALPFYVTAQVPATLSDARSGSHLISTATNLPAVNSIATPVLVSADRRARLHVHSASMDMLLDVRPLQPGRLDDFIRVRLPGTARILRARVIGDGYLDAPL